MALSVFVSGRGIISLPINGNEKTIYRTCCASFNTTGANCSVQVYSATITVTNDPADGGVYDTNSPNTNILLTALLDGTPLQLDCSPAGAIAIEPGNSRTITIATQFDELRVRAQSQGALGTETTQTGSYFISLGLCS